MLVYHVNICVYITIERIDPNFDRFVIVAMLPRQAIGFLGQSNRAKKEHSGHGEGQIEDSPLSNFICIFHHLPMLCSSLLIAFTPYFV